MNEACLLGVHPWRPRMEISSICGIFLDKRAGLGTSHGSVAYLDPHGRKGK